MTCFLIVGILFSPLEKCKVSVWNANLHQLHSSIRQFQLEYGRMPTDAEGLMVLVEKPPAWSEKEEWTQFLEAMPRDRWGKELRYVTMPKHKWGFGIYSTGADGMTSSGGNDLDDINSWDANKPWIAYYQGKRLRQWICTFVATIPVIGTALWLLILWRRSLAAMWRRKGGPGLGLPARPD
jgi:general secretion pathway protein G